MAYTVHNFEQGDILYAEQLNEMDAQIAENEESIENSVSSDMLAENYSANKTYSIGDYVIYDNELYTCIYEITAPEGWNSTHWRIANLGDGIGDLNRQLSDVEKSLTQLDDPINEIKILNWQQGYRHNQGGTIRQDNYYIVSSSEISFQKDDVLKGQSGLIYYVVLASGTIYANYIAEADYTFTENKTAYVEVKRTNGNTISITDGIELTIERKSPLYDTLQEIQNLETEIDASFGTPYSPNKVDESDFTLNGLINNEGTFTADTVSGHRCTDFIALEQNVRYIFEGKVNGVDTLPRNAGVYNYDKTFVRWFATGGTSKWVTLTGNEKYVRFCYNTTRKIDIKLYPVFDGYADIPVIKENVIVPQVERVNTTTVIRHRRPLVSFTLDGDYDLNDDFVELFETYGLKLGFAIGYNDFGRSNSLETYLDWCNNRGHEMLAYSVTPLPEDATQTLEQADKIIRDAKYELVSRGFNIYGFVGSAGVVAERYRPSVKKIYDYAATKANVTSTGEACQYFTTDDPCETWRYGLQAHTLAEMKDAIDHAESTGGLLQFYTHAETANIGYSTLENVEALIQYINSKNIDIVTPHEAFADYYTVRREDVIT